MSAMDPMNEPQLPRWLGPLVFACALCIVAWITIGTLASAPVDPNSDDGYYLFYMQSVHRGGLKSFPGLFDGWNATAHHWIFPPPSRIGFIAVSAAWAAIFGESMAALQYLSIASHLLFAIVNYLFARRHFGEARALFFAVLLSFSTLLMGLSRLPLTDSFIALCMALSVWLFLELVCDPASRRKQILFMAAFGFMVLVKELTVLLVLPFVVLALLERFWRKSPLKPGLFALVFVIPGVVTAALFVLAAGSVEKLLTTVRIVLASPGTNEYAINWGSGPWFRYLVDFLLLSPGPTLLALAFAGVFALRLRRREWDRPLVHFGLVAALLLFELGFFTKNARYAVVLELPLRMFAVCMLGELFGSARPLRTFVLCGTTVALLCWLDWQSFDLLWVRYHCADPVTATLSGMRKLLPGPAH